MTRVASSGQAAGAGVVGEPTPASPRITRYPIEQLCGAKSRGTRPGIQLKPGEKRRAPGQPCAMRKGWGTNHPGLGRCKYHGGRSPTHRRRAALQQLTNELRQLAMPEQVNPIQSLYDAVRVASWREQGLRTLLQAADNLAGPDHLGDERPAIVWQMHDTALRRKAEIAKMAVDAGLDSRMVQLAEREAEVLHRALLAGLEAGGVKSAKALDAAFEAVRLVIDDVAPQVPVGAALS